VTFLLVVDESNWPLLKGGRCSEVDVKAGLTVYSIGTTKTKILVVLLLDFDLSVKKQ
jgi:hypothetical protein